MNKQRLLVSSFLVLFALLPLLNSLSNPRVQGLHGADIVRLIAVGFCFGVAFGVLVGARRFPGE